MTSGSPPGGPPGAEPARHAGHPPPAGPGRPGGPPPDAGPGQPGGAPPPAVELGSAARRPPGPVAKALIALLAVVGLLGLPAVFLGGLLLRRAADDRPVACGAAEPRQPDPAGPRERFDAPPPPAPPGTALTTTLDTSCGVIVVRLHTDRAPNTAGALSALARARFYDGTRCHRLVTTRTLTALQCGDPTATGCGGPGFRLAEENLPAGRRPAYPRGTLAMARGAQPGTTGSQFFLVAADSDLPPEYTVAGEVVSGLDVLDRIVAVGTDNGRAPGDGAPRQRVYLDRVTVTAPPG